MATNFIGDGNIGTFVAPAGGVTSGVPIVIQQTVVLPITSAAAGETFSAYVSGVWQMPKAAGTTATAGARAYWDQVAGQVEATDAADNYLIGYFYANAVNGQTVCNVNVLAAVAADANLDVSAKANKIVPAVAGNIATLAADGDLQDGGTMAAAIAAGGGVTEAANAAAGGPWVMVSTGANRIIDDSAVDIDDVPTMAADAAAGGLPLVSGGVNKTVVASATPLTANAQGRAMIADDYFTTAEMIAGAGGKFTPGCFDTVALANVIADDAFTAAEFAAGAGGKFAAGALNTAGIQNLIPDDAFTAAEFVAGAGGKFAANCLTAAAITNLFADDSLINAHFLAGVGGKVAANAIDQPAIANIFADDAFTATEFAAGVGGKFAANCLVAAGVDNLVALDAIGEDRLTPAEHSQRLQVNSSEHAASEALVAIGEGCVGCIMFSKNVADAADLQLTLPAGYNIRVLDAWAVKTSGNGAAGDTVQIMNGGAAITNAMSLNVVDTSVVRAGTIDDAQHRVAGGALLVADFTLGGGGDTRSKVYVTYLRVA